MERVGLTGCEANALVGTKFPPVTVKANPPLGYPEAICGQSGYCNVIEVGRFGAI